MFRSLLTYFDPALGFSSVFGRHRSSNISRLWKKEQDPGHRDAPEPPNWPVVPFGTDLVLKGRLQERGQR